MATYTRALRRGLPRRPGGELWPPAGEATIDGGGSAASPAVEPAVAAAVAPAAVSAAPAAPTAVLEPVAAEAVGDTAAAPAAAAGPAAAAVAGSGTPLRRGLPRRSGADPWPPAGFAPAASAAQPAQPSPAVAAAPAVGAPAAELLAAEPAVAEASAAVPVAAVPLSAVLVAAPAAAVSARRPVLAPGQPGQPAQPAPAPGAQGFGRFTQRQWLVGVALGSGWLVVLAALVVLGVRWLLDLDALRDFLRTYPGEYHLPDGAPAGFPAWLAWQHFFNMFLMVMIIRSGLQVRSEKRPSAFWTPRKRTSGKISLTLWFHQSLDILWLVNGLVFVVLLFTTGQWMRIVPTSWEVFPNAISAALQYLSLNWPVENGWVNYNGLQQLAYFTTVFIAAPLAAITGVRMSGLWPSKATALTRAYPVEWARAVHFPVMLYFVLFIFVHVMLVVSTGALRNLNHMFGGQDAVNWTGFWIFAGSLVVIALGWAAARPLVLAPIAGLMGKVSSR